MTVKLAFNIDKNYVSFAEDEISSSTNNVLLLLLSSLLLPDIGLAVRVFANGPGDLGSIPGRVISKTQKMALDDSLLNTQHYKVRIKGKVEQSREGVAPSSTPWCSSYRKGSLRVSLDYGRQLYFFLLLLSLRVPHTSVSWWSFTGIWETVSLFRSSALFTVFWPILTML